MERLKILEKEILNPKTREINKRLDNIIILIKRRNIQRDELIARNKELEKYAKIGRQAEKKRIENKKSE